MQKVVQGLLFSVSGQHLPIKPSHQPSHLSTSGKQSGRKFGFSKAEKLLTKAAFADVFAGAKKKSTPYFVVLYRKNDLPWARLGIIAAKRQIKTAVLRNRARRVIRESFRHHKIILKGLDIVLILRSKCTLLNNDNNGNVDFIWQKLTVPSKPV